MNATATDILALAEVAAELGSADREQASSRLQEVAERVEPAVRELMASDCEAALRLVGALSAFWQDTGRVGPGRALTDEVIERCGDASATVAPRALLASSELAFRQGDQETAIGRAQAAIAAAAGSGGRRIAALAHVNLARVAFRAEDGDEIERHAGLALEIGGSDPAAQRGGLHMLAWAAYTRGDLHLAKQRFLESLDYRLSLGDRAAAAVEIANLADLAAEQGNHAEALTGLRAALTTAREVGSTYLILNLLPSVATVAAAIGDWETAARLLGATDAMVEATGLQPDPGAWQPALDAAAVSHGPAFARLRAEGRALGKDEAIALALGHEHHLT